MKTALLNNDLPQPLRKTLSLSQWIAKCKQHGYRCHYCSIPLTQVTAVKEHLTPLCRGGANHIDNIVPSCALCNQMKAWRTEAEFLRDRDWLLAKRTATGAIDKPKPSIALEERINEPHLLKRMLSERERVSWAWRNPA